MRLDKIIESIEEFAPLNLALPWDNVGLLAGDTAKDVGKAMVCLDINERVYEKCINTGAKLCISHHPFIFEPFVRMDYKDPYFNLLQRLIKSDIAVYSAHTNLDACIGGVNDALAETVGLEAGGTVSPSQDYYGGKGVVPGLGRYCSPINENTLFGFYTKTLKTLGIKGCPVNFDKDRTFKKAAVVAGAYDSEINGEILEKRTDLVLSGEIKHKDMVFLQRHNIAAIAAGHDATERTVLKPLANILAEKMPEVLFDVLIDLDYNNIAF